MSLEFRLRQTNDLATLSLGIMDLVAYRDGYPIAYMVVVDGWLASDLVYYDGTADHRYNFSTKQIDDRMRWIRLRGNHIDIRDGCLDLLERSLRK